jgi:hypothetical protein
MVAIVFVLCSMGLNIPGLGVCPGQRFSNPLSLRLSFSASLKVLFFYFFKVWWHYATLFEIYNFLTFIHTIQSHSVHSSPFAEARLQFFLLSLRTKEEKFRQKMDSDMANRMQAI